MPTPRALPSLLLLAALSSAACQAAGMPAPSFQVDRLGRSLVVRVAPQAAAYRTLYLPVADWDWVEGTVTAPGAEPVTVRADAVVDPDTQRREATLTFSDLPPGAEVALSVTLYRAGETAEAAPVAVGTETRPHVAVSPGVNALTFDALVRQAGAAAPSTAVLSGLVTSLPPAGMAARLDTPTDVVADASGTVYILDSNNGCIRRFVEDAQHPGAVTMLAGTGYPGFTNGAGTIARFTYPLGMALGADGALYVADTVSNAIRKVVIDPTGTSVVSSIAAVNGPAEPSPGAAATFPAPQCIAAGPDGVLYVGEKTRVRKLVPRPTGGYTVSTYAGGAVAGYEDGAVAKFDSLKDLAVDAQGVLYAADAGNQKVRRIAPDGAGTSTATLPMPVGVSFNQPSSLAFDAQGKLLVGDAARLYRFDTTTASPTLEVLAGAGAGFADGTGSAARFSGLAGLAATPAGVFVADSANHRLRLVAPTDAGAWAAVTKVGDGTKGNMNGLASAAAPLGRPTGVAVAPDGTVYLADPIKQQVFAIDAAGQGVTVVAGTGGTGAKDGAAAQATFNGPAGVTVCPDGTLLVTDAGNGSLRRLTRGAEGWTVSTVLSGLSYPGCVVMAPDGSAYLTESGHPSISFLGSHRVRRVTFDAAGMGTSVVLAGAGNGFFDGPGASARFYRPTGLALAADGALYIADAENHRIRKLIVDPTGAVTVSTVAGQAANGKGGATIATSQFDRPTSLVIDAAGRLVVTDYWNARLQVLDFAAGTATTLVGFPGDGYSDGPVAQARFSRPVAIAQDAQGALYVADAHPWAIRKVIR